MPTTEPQTPNPAPNAEGALVMPPREQLVAEAVARLDTAGVRSKALSFDTPTLRDLCLRLTDRKVTVKDAHAWLNKELGADLAAGDTQLVDDNVLYRFADNFRRIYGQVRREHASRVARLTVDHATDGNIRNMTRVARNRLAEMTAERLVSADNLDDLGAAEINAALSAVQLSLRAEFDTAKLELDRRTAEQRAEKLEAEIEKIRGDQARKDSQIEERVKALQARIDELSKRAQSGKSIDPAVFARIRDELMGVTA